MRCVITDYMGDDTVWEEAELRSAGIETFTAPTRSASDWLAQARDADAVITRHAQIGRSDIEQMKKCRIIARYGVGFDNIDVTTARNAEITVTNVPDFCAPEVAEHVIGLMLAVERAIVRFDSVIRAGGWQPKPLPDIRPISGLRMGLIGVGRIGQEVAARAAAFGMVVHAFDPYVTMPRSIVAHNTVEDLVKASDVLSLHLPLTDGTRRMIDAKMIARMPSGSSLINCGRGGLCDEPAVLAALDSEKLRGAGLDTFESEPLSSDSDLRGHPKVVCTPHVGYMSVRSVLEAKRGCVREVIRALSGFPPINPVPV